MTKTFCDVCGKEAGAFDLTVAKTSNGKRVEMEIAVWLEVNRVTMAHICDMCASEFLQEAVTKLNVRVATVLYQAEPPL